MGINKLLAATLDTLSNDNEMLSWTVFHDKNGITVKIRFDIANDSLRHNHQETTQYRRKSAHQMTRDRERTRRWIEQRSGPSDQLNPVAVEKVRNSPTEPQTSVCTIHSTTSPPCQGVKTRGQLRAAAVAETSSPEAVRCEPTLDPDELEVSQLSILDPAVSPGVSPTPDITTTTDPEAISDSESFMTGSDPDDPSVTGCNTAKCIHGGGPGSDTTYTDYHHCTRCGWVYICRQCLDEGGHRYHWTFLTPPL